jgi:hypothetical protein
MALTVPEATEVARGFIVLIVDLKQNKLLRIDQRLG